MPTIDWIEGQPSNASEVVKAPSFVRDVWSNIAEGVGESLFWPGSGGGSVASQGELKPGASKAFFAPTSASSNPAAATHRGRLFMASDTSRVFLYGSATTQLVGTPFLVEGPAAFAGGRVHWTTQSGSFTTNTVGGAVRAVSVTFPIAYDGLPLVLIFSDDGDAHVSALSDAGTDHFESRISASGENTYRWMSLGTVSQ